MSVADPLPAREQAEPLFFESGASWLWLLAGPAAALSMVFIQWRAGLGFPLTVPIMFLVIVSGVLALQIHAARVHTSVELTATTLREGTEIVAVKDILALFPEPELPSKSRGQVSNWRRKPTESKEPWQTARALGELSGVPRGRTGVGLQLAGRRTVQAWARDAEAFRAALSRLVDGRSEP